MEEHKGNLDTIEQSLQEHKWATTRDPVGIVYHHPHMQLKVALFSSIPSQPAPR